MSLCRTVHRAGFLIKPLLLLRTDGHILPRIDRKVAVLTVRVNVGEGVANGNVTLGQELAASDDGSLKIDRSRLAFARAQQLLIQRLARPERLGWR